FVFAYSKASPIDTWPLRSRSAAVSANASTKNSGKTVSLRSPPVLVAVTTTRPGADTAGRNAPLELAVLTNATRCDDSLPSRRDQSATVKSGPGRLKAASVPLKLPWPISSTTTASFGLARAAISVNAFSTPSRVALRSERKTTFASATASFFFAASMKLAAHFWNCAACSSSPGTPVMTSKCVAWAKAGAVHSKLHKNAPTIKRRDRGDRREKNSTEYKEKENF